MNSVAFSSGFSFTYCILSIFIVFIKCVVALLIWWVMGQFLCVSGSWVTACDPLFTLSLIADCAQTLYALRVLRKHGLCDDSLHDIFRAVAVAKLT